MCLISELKTQSCCGRLHRCGRFSFHFLWKHTVSVYDLLLMLQYLRENPTGSCETFFDWRNLCTVLEPFYPDMQQELGMKEHLRT